jgi:RNA polymerase sigma factor (sigma-70 family)
LTGALDDAISQLPPQYGSILRLWVEDGLDLNEIHKQSGLSVSAIKSRLHRARRRIKAAIEARFGPGALMPA